MAVLSLACGMLVTYAALLMNLCVEFYGDVGNLLSFLHEQSSIVHPGSDSIIN